MGIHIIIKKNKERVYLKHGDITLGFIDVAERNATVAVALDFNFDKSIIVHREKLNSKPKDDESYWNDEKFNK